MTNTQKICEALVNNITASLELRCRSYKYNCCFRSYEAGTADAGHAQNCPGIEALRMFDEMTSTGMVCVRVDDLRAVFDDNITTDEFCAARGRLAAALKRLAEPAAMAVKEPPQKGSAAEVLDTALVTTGSTLASFPDAKIALDALIDWHVAVAVDPAVNGGEVLVPKSAIDSAAEAVRKTCNVAVDDKVLVSVENWNAIVAALNCMIETDEVIRA